MSPQLNAQQVAQVLKTYRERIESKKLEITSLDTFRKLTGDVMPALSTVLGSHTHSNSLTTAADNYLTAKINWLLIDLRELELTMKMLESQSSSIVGAHVLPPHGIRGRG